MPKQAPDQAQSLAVRYASWFKVGAAVNHRTIATHAELIRQHFNSITAENEMKFESLHPKPDTFDFGPADDILDFAKQNGIQMRGHTLVWHNQTPDWVFQNDSGEVRSRAELLGTMRHHIHTVMGHYQGNLYCWDVVNEAVSDEGETLLRPSRWREQVGEDYLAQAFWYAHEADPEAQLFYNDYNETNPAKREKIYRLVKDLLDQGVPIHGIGLQGHFKLDGIVLDEVKAAIERYASLGVRLQVTELDISLYDLGDRRKDITHPDPERLAQQAERYEELFDLFRQYASAIDAVTTWGVADDETWLDDFPVKGRKDWPLLFDVQHQPKPALAHLLR